MRYFCDTNVCSKAASAIGHGAAWPAVKADLARRGLHYVVCPLVIIELIEGLALSQAAYFEEHRKRFEALRTDASEYLHFPGRFAVRAVFGSDTIRTALGPADFKQWVDTICCATDLEQIRAGRVPINASTLVTTGIDFEKILAFREDGSNRHLRRMNAIRAAKSYIAAPRAWAKFIMRSQGILPKDDSELDRFAESLNAAYLHDLNLVN